MAFPWSEYWAKEVVRMNANGLKAREIAVALTAMSGTVCTRNAVIGKMNRLGIALPTKSSLTRLERKENSAALARATAKREKELAIQTEGANNVHIFGLKPGHCRYPVAGEGIDTVFCGEERDGESYCEYHHNICSEGTPAFKPAKGRRMTSGQEKRYGF